MWHTLISYLPDWPVLMQGFIASLIPYAISRIFGWIGTKEED